MDRNPMPEASAFSLASQLAGQFTSVGEQAIRAETQAKLQEVINKMEPADREILAMKHFEEMSNAEMGQTLGISESGASKRYIRALRRLQQSAKQIQGLIDGSAE